MTTNSPAPPVLAYTVATLAQSIGYSKQYVLNDIRDGHLRASRRVGGRKWSIKPDEAERYAQWVTDGRPDTGRSAA